MKDKQWESEMEIVKMEKYRNILEEYKEIGERLQHFERKNEETLERKMQILEKLRKKLKKDEEKTSGRITRVKTLNDMTEQELVNEFLTKYRQNYERSLSNRTSNIKQRVHSAKKKQKEAISNFKFNREKLQISTKEKNKNIKEKIDIDDMKSEKSAELKKKKTMALIERDMKMFSSMKQNHNKELLKMEDSKRKVIGWHREIDERKNEKQRESIIIKTDAMEKKLEALNFRENLWNKSL